MIRSLLPSFGLVAVGATALAGCVIVTDPQPARTANNRSGVPVNGASPAATTAPAANGPTVNVDGRNYVTVSRAVSFGSGDRSQPFKGLVYFTSGGAALPNFESMQPVGVVFTNSFSVLAKSYSEGFPGIDPARNTNFAIRYEGTFTAAASGEYIFKLESDDGARFSIDNAPVVDDSGSHPAQVKTGTIRIGPGSHNFRLDYFQGVGGAALRLSVTPPGGIEKQFSANP